jgi:hypothetical protein
MTAGHESSGEGVKGGTWGNTGAGGKEQETNISVFLLRPSVLLMLSACYLTPRLSVSNESAICMGPEV